MATVKGQERKVVKFKRSSEESKKAQKKAQASRKKENEIFKATLKKNTEQGEDEESDWEDVEEDFPHVKLSELLDNLTLDAGPKAAADSSDEEKKE